MTKRKWGESFLKSGLPLEHLTAMTFKQLGWHGSAYPEYVRKNREGIETSFSLDFEVTSPFINKDTELSFLIECKYHDLARFWFFLPHESTRWCFNDRVLNCGPCQTLAKPKEPSLLSLAPLTNEGIVVSIDGTKQENTLYSAKQQLAVGFLHICLGGMFSYNIDFENVKKPWSTALVPMVVTNARLFRLRPDVQSLDVIRNASSPEEIADELPWTWCYHNPSMPEYLENTRIIEQHKGQEAELLYRHPAVPERIRSFAQRPNWLAIVNIQHLATVASAISEQFLALPLVPTSVALKRSATTKYGA